MLSLIAFALFGACNTTNDLPADVEQAFAPCSEAEIRALTTKHAVQTVFGACGSNNFLFYAWAPNGLDFYFQLPTSTHVMNAETKLIRVIPVADALPDGAWLSDALVVVPTRSAAGATQLSLYNRGQATLLDLPIPQSEPRDLQAAGSADVVLYTGTDPDGVRRAYRANFTSGQVEGAFPWLDAATAGTKLVSFTYTPALDLVAWSDGSRVVVARGADGQVWLTAEGASRGVVHPEGRYVALETLGAPISPFDQTTWDTLSPEERARREAQTKVWLERQRDWVPREVQPPVLEVYDTKTGHRTRFTAFYGDHFQWYPTPYWASFVLWGMEGKELNRNVALLDLSERLAVAAAGGESLGLEESASPVAFSGAPAPKGR